MFLLLKEACTVSRGTWSCRAELLADESSADPPIKDIHTFYGVLKLRSTQPGISDETSTPLTVEHILWANTVLAAGSAIGLVVYTGKETRAVLNTSEPETKMGSLEQEVNKMAKVSSSHKSVVYLGLRVDPVRCHIRIVCLSCGPQWFQGPVVHLRLPFPYPILIDHSYQVSQLSWTFSWHTS